jgi:predicted permease
MAGTGSVVTFLFGLVPALRASAVSPNESLKSGSGKHTAKSGLFRPLLAAQTAFTFVVLLVGGMCLASFSRLLQIDAGFNRDELALVSVEAQALQPLGSWTQLVERLQETPGIQSASLSGWGLFEGRGRNKEVRIPGRAMDGYAPWFLPVSPRFFETMGMRLLDGRDFEWRDAQPELPSAVIVNESFARRYFPGESALGRRFLRIDAGRMPAPQDIIGVVTNAKYTSIREAAPPTVYDPIRPDVSATVEVRTQLELESLAVLLRDVVPRVHPAFRVTDITMQSTLIDNSLVRDRVLALLAAFFSTVAVVLAGVGLYGVLSYSIVQRTREIGIRLALGARPVRVASLVVSEVGLMMAIGLGAGVICGAAASRFITALLYQVKGTDTWSLAAPLICLFIVCALAALFPILRATRVEPTTALRYE